MERVELKLKQASAVLGVPEKDLQNFVQARVLKPRRRLGRYYFDTNLLLQATVAIYLKGSLGASTRYLSKFADAVAELPGFESSTPAIVYRRASARTNEPPVEIRIPLGRSGERVTAAAAAGGCCEGFARRAEAPRLEA